MAKTQCKIKVCVCGSLAEAKALQTNFESYLTVLADLSPTELALELANVDDVLLKADKTVKTLRNLNESLVDFLVNLAQNAP